jgi:hypothetical protein
MPTISVLKDALYELLQRTYSQSCWPLGDSQLNASSNFGI